jgi:hypothetical protein
VAWEKVLQLLVVNRLLDPGSEFRVHRQWYLSTAMDALPGTMLASVVEIDDLNGVGKMQGHKIPNEARFQVFSEKHPISWTRTLAWAKGMASSPASAPSFGLRTVSDLPGIRATSH